MYWAKKPIGMIINNAHQLVSCVPLILAMTNAMPAMIKAAAAMGYLF